MNILKKLKPLSFLPLILMLMIIFSFSAQDGNDSGELSYEISYKIIEVKNNIFHENKTEAEIAKGACDIHFYVRKAGHMTEYFMLCLTIIFPFYLYGMRGWKLFVMAVIMSACFAAGDEYHQSFVDGRGPSIIDVGIDTSGATIGAAVSALLLKIKEKIKNVEKK